MVLSAAQMAQMSALLDEALELDEAGRRQWLDRLEPEHRELEGALRHALLLRESEGADSDRLAALPKLESADSRVNALQPGERVGPYQLERVLGFGGMAEVWLAQRADGAFKRKVALKLPKVSGLRWDVASRFARERDILAELEHPNIARLYDAGVTPEGLPYVAMEYVRGEALTAWCEAHRLGVREKVKLFLQVLDAVRYAHGHQVIHRDIKPSNILVSDSGQVRLLDFGVAKLLAEEGESTQLTRLYGRALTPEYASPELIRGDPVDTACDIYGLGVVLYELLSGTRPYQIKAGASLTALEQAMATARVERPSTRVRQEPCADRTSTQGDLARRLRGDLDAIALKALAKRPEDRYTSAAALADDLQRYLSGEPVSARPAHLLYRFKKFVLRHRIAVPVGATLLLLFAAMGWGLMRREVSTGPAAPSAASISTQRLGTQSPAPAVATDNFLAVLPFVDMSEKHDQEYFSDGLSEELIDRLSHSRNLKVVSRTSSFYFKGRQATIGEIANTLHVSHVLEGSVRRSGQALRITAQLIRTADGSHLWSQTYDRKLVEIFKVQEEIAGTVATSLKAALTSTARAPSPSTNAEAYNLLLQGIYFSRRNNADDWDRSLEFFQKAIDLVPDYALAWARLGEAYLVQAQAGWAHMADGSSKAKAAASHALKLDPSLALAHRTLAELSMVFDWDWSAARAQFQLARDLDPDDLMVALELAWLNGGMFGQLDGPIQIERKMIESDPLDTMARIYLIGNLLFAGRNEEAMASGDQLALLSPSSLYVHANRTYALLLLGRPEEALDAAQKEPDENWRLAALPVAYWALGRKAESDAALKELETKHALDAAYNIAQMHAYRGEIDSAFQWLDRAYRQHDAGMMWVRVDPLLQNLHKDHRYKVTLLKMKLDVEPTATSS
jgi:serine/threonine protein kinase/protein involved in temperature-dependent protein secretion